MTGPHSDKGRSRYAPIALLGGVRAILGPVAVRLRPQPSAAVTEAHAALAADPDDRAALRLLTKHYLAVLAQRAPGGAVEVRVPPYAAVQCIAGTSHTRGTPPAVVETDPATWIALATGDLTWDEAAGAGRISASGERSDLSAHLPL